MGLLGLNLSQAFEPQPSDALGGESPNHDLVWDLNQFKQRQLAQDFVLQFENRICVYSGSVEQIYTNFNVFFPKEENRKLVILPNPFAHHDIFHNVLEDAVKPTGLIIVPDYFNSNRQKMMLRIPLRKGKDPYRLVPLNAGLKLINSRRPPDQPLLPMLVKGDLRELDQSTPSLHLHSINLGKVGSLSPLEVAGIKAVILDKMSKL